ncbi:uncharacterized protein PG986_003769 [Apiospora aurea]|uniref:Uncharacterized protein n=1 Tax=Apiospora aurea TaxID=335848 RepID=A0ABR1QSN3_9PEZI
MKLMLNMIALLATATAAVPDNALSSRDDYWFTAGRYCTLPDMKGGCHPLKDHTGNPYSCWPPVNGDAFESLEIFQGYQCTLHTLNQ